MNVFEIMLALAIALHHAKWFIYPNGGSDGPP
jgi:hypothetical protein